MNLKQTLFVQYYIEGETKGNCEQSMLKAGYKAGYARKYAGCFIRAIKGIKKAIDDALKDIEGWEKGGRELCDRLFNERYNACVAKNDNTNAIRCIESKAKNVGYYGEDNAQRAEQVKMTEAQVKEAEAFTKWRLIQGIKQESA